MRRKQKGFRPTPNLQSGTAFGTVIKVLQNMGKGCLSLIGGLIGCVVLGWFMWLFFQALFITWPVWLLLFILGFLLVGLVVFDHEAIWRKAAIDILGPIVIGLAVAFGFILLADQFSPSARWLWHAEILLARVALNLKKLSSPSLLLFFLAALLGFLGDLLFRKASFLSRLLTVKNVLGKGALVLLTISSFTYFAQYQTEQAIRSSDTLSVRYQGPATEETLKHREELAVNRMELANLLVQESQRLSQNRIDEFRIFLRTIQEAARPLEYRGVVHHIVNDANLRQNYLGSAPNHIDTGPPTGYSPETAGQRARTTEAEHNADVRIQGMAEVLKSAIGEVLPEEENILQLYVNELVGTFADDYFERGFRIVESKMRGQPWPPWADHSVVLRPLPRESTTAETATVTIERIQEIQDGIHQAREAARQIMVESHADTHTDFSSERDRERFEPHVR
jgi:hypothetical protein